MNVFIIPSWYPSTAIPMAGIFFKEQAYYIAESNPENNIGISVWGQNDTDLTINKNIISSLRSTFNYFSIGKATRTVEIRSNLKELITTVLKFPKKIFGGNIIGITEANRTNFKAFEKMHGKVDVIHAHVSYPAGYVAMLLSKEFGVPYIITEHMGPFPFHEFLTPSGGLVQEVYAPFKNANVTIAVSPNLCSAISKFGLPTPKYIPNVVDEGFFYPTHATTTDTFNFFSLATLSPHKGIDDLLQSIKIVTGQNKQVHFTIGGGGPLLGNYKTIAQSLEISEYITWLGQISRDEAKRQFQLCHAFVLPSHGETFGVVFAEAIASGKPVITTRCGGPECIINSTNGIYANLKDPNDLAQKILFMIEHYSNFDLTEIRDDFELRFSKKAVIPQILNIYDSVVNHQI
jgi:glycosyltransferase involved in cell wall biosynthesis